MEEKNKKRGNYKEGKVQERRKKKRFSVLEELDIPILIQFEDTDEEVEGILVNLSASGIGIISFNAFPEGKRVNLTLKFEQLEVENLEGDIVWRSNDKDACRMGIKFTRIDRKLAVCIDAIADDYISCDIRISLGTIDVCFPECKYYGFCKKKEKK